jgi:hypothetical protein
MEFSFSLEEGDEHGIIQMRVERLWSGSEFRYVCQMARTKEFSNICSAVVYIQYLFRDYHDDPLVIWLGYVTSIV